MKRTELTKWVAARQLRLLGIFCLKNIANAIEQLDVALLWILLDSGDEGPGHGASCLCGDGGISS